MLQFKGNIFKAHSHAFQRPKPHLMMRLIISKNNIKDFWVLVTKNTIVSMIFNITN